MMTDAEDFYRESDNERNAERFSASMGLEPENGKVIFLDLFLYTHGIAVLTVTKKTALNRETAEKMLRNVLSAFIKQEKPDWEFPDERGAV